LTRAKSCARWGVTLMVICMVAAGLLAFHQCQERSAIIAQNEQAQLEAALKELLPEAETFDP